MTTPVSGGERRAGGVLTPLKQGRADWSCMGWLCEREGFVMWPGGWNMYDYEGAARKQYHVI